MKKKNGNVLLKSLDDEIISDNHLDEMHRAESYRIAFQVYHFLFWTLHLVALAMMVTGDYFDSTVTGIFGLIVLNLNIGLNIYYVYQTSSRGIMNRKFASKAGRKSNVIAYIFIALMYTQILSNFSLFIKIYMCELYLSMGIAAAFAIRNNKVLAKAEAEE